MNVLRAPLTGLVISLAILGGCMDPGLPSKIPEGRDKGSRNWCEFTYLTGKTGSRRVCSLYHLEEDHLKVITYQMGYAIDVYDDWIQTQGYSYQNKVTVEPHFYLVTFDLLNDASVFKRKDKRDRIAGRYIPERGWIFVSERAFTKAGYLDIPHEVCHWLNDLAGIDSDPETDERICSKFEKVYEKMVPYGKKIEGCNIVLGTPVCE